VLYACLERGLSFKTTFGNMLTLAPPLTITAAEIDQALAILDEAIAATERAGAARAGASAGRDQNRHRRLDRS
jgi:adenosylmethionine-8-amino-7-oxononanoate aminotransferase